MKSKFPKYTNKKILNSGSRARRAGAGSAFAIDTLYIIHYIIYRTSPEMIRVKDTFSNVKQYIRDWYFFIIPYTCNTMYQNKRTCKHGPLSDIALIKSWLKFTVGVLYIVSLTYPPGLDPDFRFRGAVWGQLSALQGHGAARHLLRPGHGPLLSEARKLPVLQAVGMRQN